MKSLVITALLILVSQASFAKKITEANCNSATDKMIAADLITLIKTGGDEGIANPVCKMGQLGGLVKGLDDASQSETKRMILAVEDQVKIVGPITEIQDEYGGTNTFKVNYKIIKKDGQTTAGEFTYNRVFEQSWIDDVGCAVIADQPSVSFIRNECL